MLKRLALRLTPTFFVAGVLAASFVATPLGPIRMASACSTGVGGVPTVTSLSPNSGRNAGVDIVIITGCGFADATFVYFGGTPAQFFYIKSDTTIQAATPPSSVGTVDVVVTNAHGTSAISAEDRFTFVPSFVENCKSATITPATRTALAGSAIEWIAHSANCTTPLYEFWIRFLDGKWYRKQAYGPVGIFSWDSSGFPPGKYYLVVHVKQVDHKSYDTYGVARLTLTGCIGATLSQPFNSSVVGRPVLFTANAVGCSNPVYQFWVQDVRDKWHLMQSGASSTWTWNNAGWGSGAYRIVVWVNQNSSYMGRPQTYAFKDHVLN